ncbi:MAG: hypothetical protein IPG48_13290 [Saprospiraceae bacterium]|nr:hypothetical protein [Saprospiraceae bacterium]
MRFAQAFVIEVNECTKIAPSMSTPAEFDIDPVIVQPLCNFKENHDSFGVLPKHPIFVGIEPIAVPQLYLQEMVGYYHKFCPAAYAYTLCQKITINPKY